MPFREKVAWAMSAILIFFGVRYFHRVIQTSVELGEVAAPSARYIIMYTVAIIVASIIANVVVASTAPEEADLPADEREQRILNQAGHWSGYALAVGAITGLFHFAVNENGNLMFHIIFGSLLLSQIAEYGLQIFLYRRGA